MSHFLQDECSLEPELYERAEKLFRELLPYVTDLLLWEENSELPAELQPQYDSGKFHTETAILTHSDYSNHFFLNAHRTKDNVYYCVLYNDEHHSFDHVIYTLQRSINCEEVVAQIHTSVIDKEVFLVFTCTFLGCLFF